MTSEALRRLLVAGAAVAALAAGGCSTLAGGNVGSQVLTNLQGCDRHYQGAIGAGVSGSFQIDCKAAAPAAGPVPAGGVAPAAPAPVTATP